MNDQVDKRGPLKMEIETFFETSRTNHRRMQRRAAELRNFQTRFCLLDILFGYLFYLLNPWSRILLEKLTGFKLVKKFPAFYGTRKFIFSFASVCHLSLLWASSIQFIPLHPFLKIHLNIIPIYAWVFKVVSFPVFSFNLWRYEFLLYKMRDSELTAYETRLRHIG
jgi:hypothetical protein